MEKIILLLPLYNDWKSCNYLLKKLNNKIKNFNYSLEVCILNDASDNIDIVSKKLNKIKNIKIFNFKKNLGSQKVIYFGLNYLKNIKNKIIIVMDSDGEDDINKFIDLIINAKKYPNKIIVACRTKRREVFLFKFLYRLHLILTFIFTLSWINFGNYSAFNSANLKNILKNKSGLLAYSSTLIKNCRIKKIYAKRQKRFFGTSKVSFFSLFVHSFRVIANFQTKILLTSIFYIIILIYLYDKNNNLFFLSFTFLIIFFNVLLIFVRKKFLNNICKPKNFDVIKIK